MRMIAELDRPQLSDQQVACSYSVNGETNQQNHEGWPADDTQKATSIDLKGVMCRAERVPSSRVDGPSPPSIRRPFVPPFVLLTKLAIAASNKLIRP